MGQINCLNENSDHTLQSIISKRSRNKDESVYLESDADEQLLLTIVVRPRHLPSIVHNLALSL